MLIFPLVTSSVFPFKWTANIDEQTNLVVPADLQLDAHQRCKISGLFQLSWLLSNIIITYDLCVPLNKVHDNTGIGNSLFSSGWILSWQFIRMMSVSNDPQSLYISFCMVASFFEGSSLVQSGNSRSSAIKLNCHACCTLCWARLRTSSEWMPQIFLSEVVMSGQVISVCCFVSVSVPA